MNAPATTPFRPPAERSIGSILIDAGRLNADQTERILRLQREKGLRFGEAAVVLGLANNNDIHYALARQFDYPYLQRGESKVSPQVVAAYDPFSPQVESLRALRSQLMLRWFDPVEGRRALAVVSPGSGEGRSWLAANLAVLFSQLGERTLLIDADLRKPALHTLFGLQERSGLSTLLAGRPAPEAVQRVPDLLSLSILQAGVVPPNPQELLARPVLGQLLQQYSSSFDVVIVDTPAGNRYADGAMVAVRTHGALMVARRDRSRMGEVKRYAERLSQSGAVVVGSVMNGN
ncbi:chain length determinant protein tyrosine kinase EpsG [Azoarcus indigens]|uniref:Chain length determinant protein tyrosine kinase EpsG n=1 Tax=Azoarcus indigens TaxID=29545 RepID=A0A4R6DHH7_9RHOO|nr:chain length determinant protein tyrosine kinase EpsG [Azoarcus indigens]NMG67408.1 chain length determinant protein tyrosine kinase EpsG [Azoarcus indigens]TDN44165.1 chain length determinant protein tyrosine kinase EpsG [Azoarcus indigens]